MALKRDNVPDLSRILFRKEVKMIIMKPVVNQTSVKHGWFEHYRLSSDNSYWDFYLIMLHVFDRIPSDFDVNRFGK